VRGGLLVAAVIVSLLALGVSMMPGGTTDDGATGPTDGSDRQPVAIPSISEPSTSARPSASATVSPEPSATGSDGKGPDPEPQGTTSSTANGGEPDPGTNEPATCEVDYDLVNQWPDGFQATVTITTTSALDNWRVAWSFKDGQQVGQMWDASFAQDGSRVTATAADYNKTVPADGSLAFGFLSSWRGKNSPGYDFTLNGHACTKA
jgi:cellulase/cellobiase CelA1